MIRRLVPTILALVVSAIFSSQQSVFADAFHPVKPKGYLNDRIEIELAMQLDPKDAQTLESLAQFPGLKPLAELLRSAGAKLQPSVPEELGRKLRFFSYYTVRLKGPTELPKLLKLVNLARKLGPLTIKRAGLVPSTRPPTDPYVGTGRPVKRDPVLLPFGTQWYLNVTGVDTAWNCTATGAGVVVADVDWGFDLNHAELQGQYEPSRVYNFCSGPSPGALTQGLAGQPNAYTFHGTGVAGLIAALHDGVGTQGIAFGAKIWPLQAACSAIGGEQCDESLVDGNPWAAAVSTVTAADCGGCRKVVLIEGQTCGKKSIESSIAVNGAIQTAIANNVVVVVAAGNGGKDASTDDHGDPFTATGAIIVGSTGYSDDHALDVVSNYGANIVVSAPGDSANDLTLTAPPWKCALEPGGAAYTACFGGTSGAAAKVAGVVALMLEKNPKLTPADVKEILSRPTRGAVGAGSSRPGGAFLDAAGAVAAADANGCQAPLP